MHFLAHMCIMNYDQFFFNRKYNLIKKKDNPSLSSLSILYVKDGSFLTRYGPTNVVRAISKALFDDMQNHPVGR